MTSPPDVTVLFEDHHLLVLNKPSGLLTQAPEGIPSLEAWAKAYIKEKYAKPAGVYLGIPHRLDRPVSGIVVFCRNTKAAQRVAEQFQQHRVRKVYWAWTTGTPPTDEAEWCDWLLKHPTEARASVVAEGTPGAKEARTMMYVLHRHAQGTLLELHPRTGRMHQLRVQAACRGLAFVGDGLYGGMESTGAAELPRDRPIALHAKQLTFEHPFRKMPLILEAPLPPLWEQQGWNVLS